MQCNPSNACSLTLTSIVSQSTSSSRRAKLIMLGVSSSRTNVEISELFYSKENLKMRISIMFINNNFEFRVKKSSKIFVHCQMYQGEL